MRAKLLRASRIYEARRAAGVEEAESVEAEAGAILEAEAAIDIGRIREICDAWLEANK